MILDVLTRINEFKKTLLAPIWEVHELNVIQTSCMHSIHFDKRCLKRFWTFWNCSSLFLKRFWQRFSLFTCFPNGKYFVRKNASKSDCSTSFIIHSCFLHVLKTLLAAIVGFTFLFFSVFRDCETLLEVFFEVKKKKKNFRG